MPALARFDIERNPRGRSRGLTGVEAVQIRQTELGQLDVSLHAITQITEQSLASCYGVVGLGRSGALRRKLSLGRRREVEVKGAEEGIDLTIRVAIAYGLNLAEVAAGARSRVSYEVERLTGLAVKRVEVRIEDVKHSS